MSLFISATHGSKDNRRCQPSNRTCIFKTFSPRVSAEYALRECTVTPRCPFSQKWRHLCLHRYTPRTLYVEAVDLVADFLETELERAGIAEFFADVRGMSEEELDAWVAVMGRKVNDAAGFVR